MADHQIKFTVSGIEVSSDGSLSILEIAELNGIKINNTCREGWCSDCKAICRGEVEVGKKCRIEESYRKEGYVYTCCVKPRSDLEIEA
jgi:glycine betaine catabolism B